MKTFTSYRIILIFIAIFSLSGCQNEKVNVKVEGENLMQASRDWSKAAEARDVEKTLTYWSDDAIVISAGQPELKGKQAIRGMVEGSIKDPNFNISWEPISAEISENGDMGYLLENSTITMKDSTGKETVQNFRTVTIWKKQADGSWKNVVDVMSPK
ncbi:MAG: nuclear transport factor 2 family protein [Aequorivita sp.]|nr:nuclear transport factor 2 family protein [Aequorivita sp.]